jgi:hypothetical protein
MLFQDNLAGFNVAAGSPAIAIDFDSIAAGTNIAGNTIAGVTFTNPSGNTLDVVTAASTFTPGGFSGAPNPLANVLSATSGANVLSPGGASLVPGPDVRQRDGLRLDFAIGQKAVGIDVLLQSDDCCSFMSFQVFDTASNSLSSGTVAGAGGGGGQPGGTHFMGFFSNDATLIGRIVFIDGDDNNQFPDANFGYDTLRLSNLPPTNGSVPAPGVLALLGLGLFGLAGCRRR